MKNLSGFKSACLVSAAIVGLTLTGCGGSTPDAATEEAAPVEETDEATEAEATDDAASSGGELTEGSYDIDSTLTLEDYDYTLKKLVVKEEYLDKEFGETYSAEELTPEGSDKPHMLIFAEVEVKNNSGTEEYDTSSFRFDCGDDIAAKNDIKLSLTYERSTLLEGPGKVPAGGTKMLGKAFILPAECPQYEMALVVDGLTKGKGKIDVSL